MSALPSEVIAAAQGLRSERGENPEYDRALVELACTLLNLSTDDGGREFISDLIGVVS